MVWTDNERRWWLRFLEAYDQAGRPGLAEYTSVMVDRWVGSRYVDREPWVVSFIDLMLRRQSTEALLASLRAWVGTELALEGNVPPIPALVLWNRDGGARLQEEARIRSALPSVRREVVEAVGAAPHLVAPQIVGQHLRRLFEQATPVSPPRQAGAAGIR